MRNLALYTPQIKTPDQVWHYLIRNMDKVWISDSGFGMPPLDRYRERGPLQHGASDTGFRLQARSLTLALDLYARNEDEYWTRRAEILDIFKPSDTPLILKVTIPSIGDRSLNVHYSVGLSLDSQDGTDLDWSGLSQRVAIEMTASDPCWYDPLQKTYIFDLGLGGGDNIPWPIPFPVGSSNANIHASIAYGGSWRTEPIVTIKGPIIDPVLTNVENGAKLDFTGVTLAETEKRVINCNYGYKTVVDELGANKIDELTSDSDLAYFRIEASPEVPSGVNEFLFTGDSGNAATRVYLQYYDKFIGI